MHTTDRVTRFRPWRRLLTVFGFGWAALCAIGAPARAQTTGRDADRALLVMAAASMADVLPQVAIAWERSGGDPVVFSFSATSRAAAQALQDPTADVIISADRLWMEWLHEGSALDIATAVQVASNELVVVVPRGAPSLTDVRELPALGRLALAGENVPAGRYARAALEAKGVWETLEAQVVRGASVRGALEWVARGEVPAGIVYRTDARAQPAVRVAFAFEPADHPAIAYWASALTASDTPASAKRFVEFLASSPGQDILRDAGFSGPPSSEGESASPSTQAASGVTPTSSMGSAIRLSLIVALLATVVGLLPAIGLGWILARKEFTGKAIVSTLVMAPLVLPPVVTGFLLLSALGASTPLGGLLARAGLPVPFTVLGAAIAALVVGMPLYVISIRGAFEAIDPSYEELSSTLGVTPGQTFLRVSLPLALPGIAAGAVLAFARALGEFGATVVLAGNVEGSTRTIALAVYTLLKSPTGREQVWMLVGASVAISLLALLGFEVLSRRQKQRLEDRHAR